MIWLLPNPRYPLSICQIRPTALRPSNAAGIRTGVKELRFPANSGRWALLGKYAKTTKEADGA